MRRAIINHVRRPRCRRRENLKQESLPHTPTYYIINSTNHARQKPRSSARQRRPPFGIHTCSARQRRPRFGLSRRSPRFGLSRVQRARSTSPAKPSSCLSSTHNLSSTTSHHERASDESQKPPCNAMQCCSFKPRPHPAADELAVTNTPSYSTATAVRAGV